MSDIDDRARALVRSARAHSHSGAIEAGFFDLSDDAATANIAAALQRERELRDNAWKAWIVAKGFDLESLVGGDNG
jgi:hypothetical protein